MSDDFEDLVAPPRRKRGRPSNAELEARRAQAVEDIENQAAIRNAVIGRTVIPEKDFFMPVGVNFLHRILGMDNQTIRTRLRGLPPLPGSHPNRPVWHFRDALPYLVKPKMTAEEFARTLNKADLPPEINKSFWDAQRSRVKYKIESQEAWETEDVLEVLGDVAMTMKDSLVAVVEEMRNRARLTDEQTELLQECIDELRTEIRTKLIEMPAKRSTGSIFAKPMFGIRDDVDREPDIPETGWLDDEGDEE